MNNTELNTLLNLIQSSPDSDDLTATVMQLVADSAALKVIKNNIQSNVLAANGEQGKQADTKKCVRYPVKITFTKKELSNMSSEFLTTFRHQGCLVRVYRRESSEGVYNYEFRYRRNGYNVYASANDFELAKKKFTEKLKIADKLGPTQNKAPAIPNTIDGFADYYFENFYKRKVTAETLRVALNQYKNHISPHFKNAPLKKITPKMCQELLDALEAQGKGKTLDDVFTILNIIFKAAVKHILIHNNPMDMVFHTKHEHKHGSALSKKEEKKLLASTAGTPQQLMFAIALYTGMRPNEYETAKLEGEFIVAVNSKRKNGKVEYKKIPITPMLKPYLEGVETIEFSSLRIMRDRFNKIFPQHKLYDLRTTFYTRCQECGVADVARDEFVGHSHGALGNAYTDLSDEFLLREGKKFKY